MWGVVFDVVFGDEGEVWEVGDAVDVAGVDSCIMVEGVVEWYGLCLGEDLVELCVLVVVEGWFVPAGESVHVDGVVFQYFG